MKKMITTLALAVAGVLLIGITTATTQTPEVADPGLPALDPVPVALDEPAPVPPPPAEPRLSPPEVNPEPDVESTPPEDLIEMEEPDPEPEPAPEVVEPDIVEADVDPDEDLIELDADGSLAEGIDISGGADELITLTLDDVPLQDVLRMFTRISGANIVAGTNLAGRVTVSLRDVAWKPAMEVILDSVGMVLVERSDDIFMVMSRSEMASAPIISDTVFLQYSSVSNLLPVVKQMLISTNASVAGVPGANGLVIQETAARMSTIKETLEKIDRPRPQVFIEAKFVELNDSAMKDIGIDWEVLRGYGVTASGLNRIYTDTRSRTTQDAYGTFDTTQTQRTDSDTDSRNRAVDNLLGTATADTSISSDVNDYLKATSQTIAQTAGRNFEMLSATDDQITFTTLPTFFSETVQSAILSADDFRVVISALEENGGVSVVSNPKVVVANNETANIHVGRNQPNIVAVPTGDTGDRFAYTLDRDQPFIEIGVKVEVTPTVNTESNITVRIKPELSRLLGMQEVGDVGISFPITQIRQIETEFNLKSGNTAAIGGLTETADNENIKKIPLLGDIPILGKYLFSHRHMEEMQDEVVIFVTVGMAQPESISEITGVPAGGRLIHQHLAREALDAQDVE